MSRNTINFTETTIELTTATKTTNNCCLNSKFTLWIFKHPKSCLKKDMDLTHTPYHPPSRLTIFSNRSINLKRFSKTIRKSNQWLKISQTSWLLQKPPQTTWTKIMRLNTQKKKKNSTETILSIQQSGPETSWGKKRKKLSEVITIIRVSCLFTSTTTTGGKAPSMGSSEEIIDLVKFIVWIKSIYFLKMLPIFNQL